MLRMNNKKWSAKTEQAIYNYDYTESYWVVDDEYFRKDINSNCTISKPADKLGHNRKLENVACGEWYFYLCQRKSTRPEMRLNATVNPLHKSK